MPGSDWQLPRDGVDTDTPSQIGDLLKLDCN